MQMQRHREQTAHLQTALLHRCRCGPRYEPLSRTPFARRLYPEGLNMRFTEFACCRSDLCNASSRAHIRQKYWPWRFCHPAMVGMAREGTSDLTETWLASKRRPLTSTAHKIRAFLFASATTAFCQPTLATNCTNHCEIRSRRLCAVITADFAPWISNVRR